MTNQSTDPDPDDNLTDHVLIPSPAAAYDRAFAETGVPVPAALRVQLPTPLSRASDQALLDLLAVLDERENALNQVLDRLSGLPGGAEREFSRRVLRGGVEATGVIRDCLLLELTWRATRHRFAGQVDA